MSAAGDYSVEMERGQHIGDAAIEAFFTGNGAGGELASLVALAEDLRGMARGPLPAPSAELARLLTDGFALTGNLPAPAPSEARPTRRTALARALAAFGVVAAGLTVGGAAGALPGPAQDLVSSTVAAVTPFSFPHSAEDDVRFDERVRTDAHDGGADGRAVSEDAKQNGDANRADGAGRPEAPGAQGLDRAGETPAAGHVPTSVPSGRPDSAGPPIDPAPGGPLDGVPAPGDPPASVPDGPPADPTAAAPAAGGVPPADDPGAAPGKGRVTGPSSPAPTTGRS